LLHDNGDRFYLFHDLGIPLIYHGGLLQKIKSSAASARGSRMPIVVDLLRLMKGEIKIPTTIHDVVISFNDEYELSINFFDQILVLCLYVVLTQFL